MCMKKISPCYHKKIEIVEKSDKTFTQLYTVTGQNKLFKQAVIILYGVSENL